MAGKATITIGGKSWEVYVATDPAELSAGLSNLSSIPVNTGMFFDTGYDHTIAVTTAHMLFNLDIVFIDSNLKVTEILPSVLIGNVPVSSLPCRYFLEVNSGETDGILAGDDVVVMLEDGTPPVYPVIAEEESTDMSAMFNTMIGIVAVMAAAGMVMNSMEVQ